jgi:DNA invertase Pin-like site-specific DNA recombinase
VTTTVDPPPLDEDEVSLLDWLRLQADQNVPEALQAAAVPVAWLGRTSTDDAQDPTLSLPRQLDNCRRALPPGFVIVAKFYDVESGRTTVENRGKSSAHEQLDNPIARDGSIADLLGEARRADRRFVAVVVESIERVARVTYFSTKIEFELEKAGVALLAADEGIDHRSIPDLNRADSPYRKATPTLTRRIKQAIAEWYVLNMLELTWGGLKAHTAQGYNIGKPPYGYLAQKQKHPVKAKAREGKTKHRLIADPVKGPVVTQIFHWRAVLRLGYDEIAYRLNLDPDRYPPPDPILGEGRRRIGAWTGGSVREVLDNPKHTGYMVWNRRKRGHRSRDVRGRVNPPSAWVWSPRPTHDADNGERLGHVGVLCGKRQIGRPRRRWWGLHVTVSSNRADGGESHAAVECGRADNDRDRRHLDSRLCAFGQRNLVSLAADLVPARQLHRPVIVGAHGTGHPVHTLQYFGRDLVERAAIRRAADLGGAQVVLVTFLDHADIPNRKQFGQRIKIELVALQPRLHGHGLRLLGSSRRTGPVASRNA